MKHFFDRYRGVDPGSHLGQLVSEYRNLYFDLLNNSGSWDSFRVARRQAYLRKLKRKIEKEERNG